MAAPATPDPLFPNRNAPRSVLSGQGRPAAPEILGAGPEVDPLLNFEVESRKPQPEPDPWRQPARWNRAQIVRVAFIGLVSIGIVGALGGVFAFLLFATPPAPAPTGPAMGTATIDSKPQGAEVVIDGVLRGVTPVKLTLAVGKHELELEHKGVKRTVALLIEPGPIASQYIELGPEAPPPAVTRAAAAAVPVSPGTAVGWVALQSPVELQVLRGGRLIGTTSAERLMLPAGRNDLELASDAYDFRTTVRVEVGSGRTHRATVFVPNGSVSVNALPWAEVWIDGKPVGTTPLANLAVPIGAREIVWRHPKLGERRQTVRVTAKSPVRIGMDFSK